MKTEEHVPSSAPPISVPAPTATLDYSVSKGFEMRLISQCVLVVVMWSAVWWDNYRTHSCKSTLCVSCYYL